MKAKTVSMPLRDRRERYPVRIVADAAVSTRGLHGGRLLPLVLLDTADRPDVAELIRIHEYHAPGDVRTQWGQLDGHEGTVALFLSFIRPMELFVILEFDIVKQGILVEQSLIGEGIIIAKAEANDDRWIKNPNRVQVIVEVGDTGFRATWDKLFNEHLRKHFRAEGLSRSESRRAATSLIDELRKFATMKMRDVLP
jgi:hypothetical protein